MAFSTSSSIACAHTHTHTDEDTLGRRGRTPPGGRTHPSREGGPGGDALAEVPEQADDDDAGLQPVGSSLLSQHS